MRPPALDDPLVLRFEAFQRRYQLVDRGKQLILYDKHRRDVHGRRERVVRRLAHVDVVVGMKRFFQRIPRQLCPAPCDDLVRVHIGLRTGARLPYDKRKMIVQRTGYHLVAGGGYGRKLRLRHALRLQRMVGHRARFFQNTERMRDFTRHRLDADAYLEILMASLSLSPPVFVGRHFHLAHRIMFHTIFHKFSPFPPSKGNFEDIMLRINGGKIPSRGKNTARSHRRRNMFVHKNQNASPEITDFRASPLRRRSASSSGESGVGTLVNTPSLLIIVG